MSWKWFGVKTLFRSETVGKPKAVDKNFDEDATSIEERIVLIKARNFDEAIKKGEIEAKAYLFDYENIYGQKVKQRYLEVCNVFELYNEPNKSGVEVFSSTEIVSKDVKDKVIIDNKFGKDEELESTKQKRKNFYNAEFSKPIR